LLYKQEPGFKKLKPTISVLWRRPKHQIPFRTTTQSRKVLKERKNSFL